MKIGDQRQRTLKDLKVRRVLKDNKVPGISAGTRAAETPNLGAGSAAGFLGQSQAGLCEQPGACLDQGILNSRNFSKRKRENRGTQRRFRQLSSAAVASCAPTPSDPGLWTQDKQCQPTPEAQLAPTQISGLGAHMWNPGWAHDLISNPAAWEHRHKAPGWAGTPETPARRPHLKPQVGAQTDQWLAAPLAQTQSCGWQRNAGPKPPGNKINALTACGQPHLKAPVLNHSYIAPPPPPHRALQGLLAI